MLALHGCNNEFLSKLCQSRSLSLPLPLCYLHSFPGFFRSISRDTDLDEFLPTLVSMDTACKGSHSRVVAVRPSLSLLTNADIQLPFFLLIGGLTLIEICTAPLPSPSPLPLSSSREEERQSQRQSQRQRQRPGRSSSASVRRTSPRGRRSCSASAASALSPPTLHPTSPSSFSLPSPNSFGLQSLSSLYHLYTHFSFSHSSLWASHYLFLYFSHPRSFSAIHCCVVVSVISASPLSGSISSQHSSFHPNNRPCHHPSHRPCHRPSHLIILSRDVPAGPSARGSLSSAVKTGAPPPTPLPLIHTHARDTLLGPTYFSHSHRIT